MRLSDLISPKNNPRQSKDTSRSSNATRRAQLEPLDRRELLALAVTTADYRALVNADSLGSDESSAVWVTSLKDVTNVNDGEITFREALDYACQKLTSGETVASRIRFSVGGSITLSTSSQSLKILSKSISVDASNVGGITVQGNTSLLLYVFGGTDVNPVSAELKGLTFQGNSSTSTSSKGAAIQVSSGCSLTLVNCNVMGNTSTTGLGGGIYVSSGALTLIDSNVSGNTSGGTASKGGAIYVDSGSLDATRAVFSGNSANDGGGIYVKNGSASFNGCYFRENSATSGDGGALYMTGATLHASNVSFLSNTSSRDGGAFYVDGEGDSILDRISFTGNQAENGGAVYQDSLSLTITDARFDYNVATQNGAGFYVCQNALTLINKGSFLQNTSTVSGGAIYNAGWLELNDSELNMNSAQKSGGGLHSSNYFEISHTSFSDNSAGINGGAVYSKSDLLSWLFNSKIENSSAYEGAGVYNESRLSVADSYFCNNVASANGGGFVNVGDMTVSGSEFSGNVAQGLNGAGGAGLNYPQGKLTVANSTLSGNSSPNGSGGALANSGTLSVSAVNIDANTAGELGGAILNGGGLSVFYSTFSSNKANNGGAIAATYGSSTMATGATLWGNDASKNGGAIYSYGTMSFEGANVSYNTASTSAVAAYYYDREAVSAPEFDSTSVLSNNVASSEVETPDVNSDVAVINAQSYDVLNKGVYFGAHSVLDGTGSESYIIKNIGQNYIKFSGFTALTNAETSTFTYKLTSESGQTINTSKTFTLAPDQSVLLTVSVSPKKVGSKYFKITWNTKQTLENGTAIANTDAIVPIYGSAEIAKAASVSTSVSNLTASAKNVITGSVSVSLPKAPTGNVVVYLAASDNAILSAKELLFTHSNYNETQTVTVTLDNDYLRENGAFGDYVLIKSQIFSSDSIEIGAALTEITMDIPKNIPFIGDNAVDLNAYGGSNTVRWDLNGDGSADVTTSGQPVWIDSSAIEGNETNKISASQKSGSTTKVTTYDAVTLTDLPSAYGELETFTAVPGMARLSVTATNGAVKTWRVDWGDGSPLSEITDELSLAQVFSHCYLTNGVYAVSIQLIDSNDVTSGWLNIGTVNIKGLSESSSAIVELVDEFEFESDLSDVAENVACLDAQIPSTAVAVSIADLSVNQGFSDSLDSQNSLWNNEMRKKRIRPIDLF